MAGKCTEYVEATAKIFFEKNKVACAYCPMLSESPRYQCRRTGEYLIDTRVTTGKWCPLVIQDA